MNIIFEHRRHGTRAVDLRWAAALAFAAAAFSACGSDPPERQGATNNAEAAEQRVLYEHIDNEADARAAAAEQRALYDHIDHEADARAEAAEQRVLYEHIDNEADTRAELAEAQARARQERSARLIG